MESSKVSEYVIDSSLWICKMYKNEYGDQSNIDLYLRHIFKTSQTHVKNESDVINILW